MSTHINLVLVMLIFSVSAHAFLFVPTFEVDGKIQSNKMNFELAYAESLMVLGDFNEIVEVFGKQVFEIPIEVLKSGEQRKIVDLWVWDNGVEHIESKSYVISCNDEMFGLSDDETALVLKSGQATLVNQPDVPDEKTFVLFNCR